MDDKNWDNAILTIVFSIGGFIFVSFLLSVFTSCASTDTYVRIHAKSCLMDVEADDGLCKKK